MRTPLAAIATQAHLVLGATELAERRRLAQGLQDGLERVSHLLAQLLTIARIDAPGTELRLECVDVAGLVRERLAALSAAARARSISLVLECPDTLTAQINPSGFVSIVDNLVDNAIRYTPSGGHVAVSLGVAADDLEFVVRAAAWVSPLSGGSRKRMTPRCDSSMGCREQALELS